MKVTCLIIMISVAFLLQADYEFASSLYEDGLYEEAIQEFEKIVKLSPTSDQAARSIFFIGASYQKMERFDNARINYTRLLKAYPEISFKDEVLFSLGLTEFRSGKYPEAAEFFTVLINQYPLTENAKNSLKYLTQAFFGNKEYKKVILKADELITKYRGNPQIPELMLIQARAYLKLNLREEAEINLRNILKDYEGYNVYWEATELELILIESKLGKSAVIDTLYQRIKRADIPRQYEEKLLARLLDLYLELTDYELAMPIAEDLITKFNNSEELDHYIISQSICYLETGNFQKIISNAEGNKKIFRESDLEKKYHLLLAKAFYLDNNNEEALNLIKEFYREQEIDSSDGFEAAILKSDIMIEQGNFYAGIEIYQQLMNQYSGKKDEVLFKLGNVYFEKLADFGKSARFFEQLLLNYPASEFRIETSWRLGQSHQELGEYKLALNELKNIDLNLITDARFRKTIIDTKAYLKKFLIRDTELALERLISGVIDYTEDMDILKLRKEMIDILGNDLKNYATSLALLSKVDSDRAAYQRAKLLLNLIEKNRYEENAELEATYLKELDQELILLESANTEWFNEITLKKNIVLSNEIKAEQISALTDFLEDYKTSEANAQLLLIVFKYYRDMGDLDLAASYASRLEQDPHISPEDYHEAMIFLAEYFYSRNDDENARKNYSKAEVAIDLNRPQIWFHYSVVLYQTGYKRRALDMLDLLLNNVKSFPAYKSAVNYYSAILSEKTDHHKAIEIRNKLVESERDDAFYLANYQDYLALDDKENAKTALMKITDKDDQLLESLALLHYDTDDLIMANHTYQQLLKKDSSNLDYNEMLGKIAFKLKDYQESADYYEKVDQILGEDYTTRDGIIGIAKEYIISLYQINNRPKADTILKKYKSVMLDQDLLELKLHEGIYFSGIDKKKAFKLFNNVIESSQDAEIKAEAMYQRALLYLEDKEIEKAESDLRMLAKSGLRQKENQANLKLGTLKFSQEKFQEALDHYYYVIAHDSSGVLAVDAARNFAYVCKTMEEWQKAVAAYEIILEKWGDDELEGETIFDIAFCHYRDRKYYNAVEMFEKALVLLQNHEMKAEAQYWLGESYFGLEDFQRSVTEFLKIGYDYPEYIHWAASGELRAGEIYSDLNEIKKAKRIYQRVIDNYGLSSQWGQEAQVRLNLFEK